MLCRPCIDSHECAPVVWKARAEAAEALNAEFGAVALNVVPGDDGMGQEVAATPESLRSRIAELQSEWDGAETSLADLKAELKAPMHF